MNSMRLEYADQQSRPHSPTPSDEAPIFDPPAVARSYGPPVIIEGPYRRVPEIPTPAPYRPPDWEAPPNAAMLTDFRDELARLEGVITPGVDNTPFIQYAIEALTRDRDETYSSVATSGSEGIPSGPSFAPGQQSQYHGSASTGQRPLDPVPATPVPTDSAQPDPQLQQHPPRPFIPSPRASAHSLADSLLKSKARPVQPHEWRPVGTDEILAAHQPPLTFRPWPLRTPALFVFMGLCVLMIAALIVSAVYSQLHQGLLAWAGIYGGRYFLFRIFPQLVAAAVLLYAQFLAATMLRILPFARLASSARREREGALFQEMYPSFLWPRLVGPWNVWVPVLVTWLINLTIPLQSSLFTVILVGQTWTWATVQGVAWTLVALYLALLVSTVIVWRYWAGLETTGLIWDPRSLADIAALVSETNTADDYRGTQLARSREGIRFALRRRVGDRLGYWTWKDGRPGLWYALGSPMDAANLFPIPGLAAGQRMQRRDDDLEASRADTAARYRYLPWCLRSTQLLWFTITTFVFLLAIIIAAFLPSTRLIAGFRPSLKPDPQPGAFSAADFFYSFFPSLLGLVPFLLFQTLDLHLRILQPWAALSSTSHHGDNPPSSAVRGAPATRSLLADYAACAPLQSALHALRNRHWRLAATSALASLFVLIPVLAGGMFMALTITTPSTTTSTTSTSITAASTPLSPDDLQQQQQQQQQQPQQHQQEQYQQQQQQEVRIFPNTPAFSLLLALLVLYLAALLTLLLSPARRRRSLRMPHAVTCLAELVGYLVYCAAAETREDDNGGPFKEGGVRSRGQMLARMGVVAVPVVGGERGGGRRDGRRQQMRMESRWAFGFGHGEAGEGLAEGNGEGQVDLGVRRVRRFTEKRRVRKSQIRRAD